MFRLCILLLVSKGIYESKNKTVKTLPHKDATHTSMYIKDSKYEAFILIRYYTINSQLTIRIT